MKTSTPSTSPCIPHATPSPILIEEPPPSLPPLDDGDFQPLGDTP